MRTLSENLLTTCFAENNIKKQRIVRVKKAPCFFTGRWFKVYDDVTDISRKSGQIVATSHRAFFTYLFVHQQIT